MLFTIPRCPHEVGSSPKSTKFQWEPSEMQSKSKDGMERKRTLEQSTVASPSTPSFLIMKLKSEMLVEHSHIRSQMKAAEFVLFNVSSELVISKHICRWASVCSNSGLQRRAQGELTLLNEYEETPGKFRFTTYTQGRQIHP